MGAAVRLTGTLLDSCPRLRVLATSRETLGVAGEVDRPVPTLSLPDAPDGQTVVELEGYESVRLFAERALFVERSLYGSSGFALVPDNARAVAEICWRLEGMPLAIELAAAWVGTLTVDEISKRLKGSLRLLKSGSRSVTDRQRTIRGAIDWSYALLDEPERALFRRLSVFAGGWALEAAETIGADDDVEEEEVLDLLWRLVNKSLVVAGSRTEGTGADGTARYRMLEPIRQYARERLEESGKGEEIRGRHAAFYLALAEEAGPGLTGPQQGSWVNRLEREHDNLRAALSWILRGEEAELALRFCGALWRYWYNRGDLSEGVGWLESVLASSNPQPTPLRLRALEGMGWLLQLRGDPERAEATYEEMLELSTESGDKEHLATALNSLGNLSMTRGDNERARGFIEENMRVLQELDEGNVATTLKKFYAFSLLGAVAANGEGDYAEGAKMWGKSLALAQEAGDTYLIGITHSNLGFAALMQRDFERARTYCEEALALARELGGAEIAPLALVNLGLTSLGLGEYDRARTSLEEALSMSQTSGIKPQVIESLEGMASLAGTLGEDARAARLWGAAEAARETTGIALPPGERALHEPYLAGSRSRLGEATWERALAEGRVMSLEEAAEYALSEKEESAAPLEVSFAPEQEASAGTQPPNLTRREKEIAALVARGLTSPQIASKLVLSTRTVDKHVTNILKKLGLRSRDQISARMADQPTNRPVSQ